MNDDGGRRTPDHGYPISSPLWLMCIKNIQGNFAVIFKPKSNDQDQSEPMYRLLLYSGTILDQPRSHRDLRHGLAPERVTGSSHERSWRRTWSHGSHLGRHFNDVIDTKAAPIQLMSYKIVTAYQIAQLQLISSIGDMSGDKGG